MKLAVKVKNLNFSYAGGLPVLKNLSFEIFEGDRVGLIGPNGAGKTSLLFHFNGLLEGRFEEFKVFGHSLADRVNLPKIREMVGIVFQDPNDQLFMPTVFDDVGFAPLQKGLSGDLLKSEVRQALNRVGLGESFENKMAHHLSQGEKRKVSLASIFTQKPQMLVLDEPTASLDPAGQRELLEILHGYRQTLVLASHDLNLVRKTCQKIIFLKAGELIYCGPAEPVINNQKFLLENGL